jgi:signal transduction histidine kinase
MRSLTVKLTLAFLVVALTGAGLVTIFLGRQTQQEFNRFVLLSYQREIVDRAATYYESNGGWDRISTASPQIPPIRVRGRDGPAPDLFTLLDEEGRVLLAGRQYEIGAQITRSEMERAVPVKVDGRTVGWILFGQEPIQARNVPGSPELDFLHRMQQALIWGALGATIFALLIGIFLARTISRPVRELTGATKRVAAGELGVQVPVRTGDELGELANSFNQMSADLAQSNQARRQMTADVAHDLRTPLSVILGYTEALSDGKLEGTPQMYGVMHSEARHLSHLIDDLRFLSLADAGELPLQRRDVPPLDLLNRTAAAHQAAAGQKQIDLQVQVAPDLPDLHVDPERMSQVLGNLTSNALRHTPAGGSVVLAAKSGTEGTLLQVRDTGSGIDTADLPYIFHRFYRGDRSRQQNGESGLGLAIAKSIVEAHGGTITAESTSGAGTTFTITLPRNA